MSLNRPLPLIEVATACALGVIVLVFWRTLGGVSQHMLAHIFGMTLVAPALALVWVRWPGAGRLSDGAGRALWPLTLLQLVLFLSWHAPGAMAWAMSGRMNAVVMHASLGLAAFGFWLAVFRQHNAHKWHAVMALLLTGKSFCLAALLLVMSPRPLYGVAHNHLMALADQQLAGAIMVAICPLTYVLAAVIILARWFLGLAREQQRSVADGT